MSSGIDWVRVSEVVPPPNTYGRRNYDLIQQKTSKVKQKPGICHLCGQAARRGRFTCKRCRGKQREQVKAVVEMTRPGEQTMILTHADIEAGATCQGQKKTGWNRSQLLCFGIEWPPPHGWKSGLVGQEVSTRIYERFLKLRTFSDPPQPGISRKQRRKDRNARYQFDRRNGPRK